MEITNAQFTRIVSAIRTIAGEAGKIEFYSRTVWFTGSELATLRLALAYRTNDKASFGFSKNLQTHYFALQMPSFVGEMAA